ncbi:hypothetical protein D3C85_1432540 [compost metagenome]
MFEKPATAGRSDNGAHPTQRNRPAGCRGTQGSRIGLGNHVVQHDLLTANAQARAAGEDEYQCPVVATVGQSNAQDNAEEKQDQQQQPGVDLGQDDREWNGTHDKHRVDRNRPHGCLFRW